MIAESGGSREDRQKLTLEAWRDAVHGGRYAGLRYDCASASVAWWISRLANKVWLTAPDLRVRMQATAEEVVALARADAEAERAVTGEHETNAGTARTPNGSVSIAPGGSTRSCGSSTTSGSGPSASLG